MAPQEPSGAQGKAAEEAVPLDGLMRIDGAGGVEPATGTEERRQGELVKPDQGEDDGFHDDIRF
jgi:hypothetical protein